MAAARRALALGLLLLLALQPAPQAAAAPSVEAPIMGYGIATRYTLYALGYALEGGAADVTIVCASCLIQLTVIDSAFTYAAPSGTKVLPPGTYEVRDYRGLVQITGSEGRFDIILSGTGDVNAL